MHGFLLLFAGIVLWIVLHRAARHFIAICRNCGSQARTITISPRSLVIELILWFAGLFPGVIYTLWCNYVEYEACPKCKSRDIVPLDSPVGRTLAQSHTETYGK